jgi:DNA-binding NtrC family response regulator
LRASPQNTSTILRDAQGKPWALSQPAFLLKFVKGPDRRRQLKVTQGLVRLGTQTPGFQLTDATVSAVHCEVRADSKGVRIVDLGSKNGTRLGGHRVSEAWLEDGDVIELGKTWVRFSLLNEAEPQPLSAREGFGALLGSSPEMRALYSSAERIVDTPTTVLIQGETGTGKELLASALVAQGPRAKGPLVIVDCAQLAPSLAESELFGHEVGAFTGASRALPGAFERAQGGTVVLDEVGELAIELQAKLLGVLERRTVQRLGAEKPIALDVRIIATTRLELEREVNRGRFRADLYHRLAVIELRLPALRERREDIPGLVVHFTEELGARSLPPDVLEQLYQRDYPGNVRELRNAVERASLGLPLDLAPPSFAPPDNIDLSLSFQANKLRINDQFERTYLRKLIESTGGNVSEAARKGRMDRMHLHRLLRRYGLSMRD